MGFIGWIIALVVISIVCRALRSIFKVVDWIAYLIVLAAFVIVWITNGFWMGLLAGIIGCVVVAILFNIGGGTEVKMFGHTYTLECDKCGYDHLEILEYTEVGVRVRCKRCGKESFFILRH